MKRLKLDLQLRNDNGANIFIASLAAFAFEAKQEKTCLN